ncbi:MAG: hypothetical protein H5T96_04780 [Tissierellales bacterium]|nr:hypothetical protein [Tissierellales bacterium]
MKKRYIFLILIIILLIPILFFRKEIKFLWSIANSRITQSKIEDEIILENPLEKYINDIDSNISENTNTNSSVKVDNTKLKNSKIDKNVNTLSMDEIAVIYNPKFKLLEDEFNKTLDNLVADAIADYNTGNYSKFDLARFYLDKGYKIEKESDIKFYALVDELEKDLKKNSLDLSLKDEIVSYYKNVKSVKKNSLIDKGMALVNAK